MSDASPAYAMEQSRQADAAAALRVAYSQALERGELPPSDDALVARLFGLESSVPAALRSRSAARRTACALELGALAMHLLLEQPIDLRTLAP